MKKGLGLLVFLVVVLMIATAGCGETEETPEAVEEPAEPEEDTPAEEADVEEDVDSEIDGEEELFDVDYWVAPETYQDFVATIKEIQYSVGEAGGEKFSINYKHLGTEEVEGVQTDKVEFSIEGEGNFTMWIDRDGEFRRLVTNGEEFPAEMAQMVAAPMMSMVMLPFHQVDTYNIANLGRHTVDGITHKHIGTENETYGDLSARVHSIEISAGPPAVPEGESGSAIIRVADFGDFQMVTGWEVHDADGESFEGEFVVEKIYLR